MATLFIGNFAFEERRERPHDRQPALVERFEAEMATTLLPLMDDGDFLLCPQEIAPADWDRLQALIGKSVRQIERKNLLSATGIDRIVPWGWNSETRALADQLKVTVVAPPQEVIWRVNSREFSAQLENELGCAPAGLCICRTAEDVKAALSVGSSRGWLLKKNFSQAGRGQLRAARWDTAEAFVRGAIQSGEVVIVEPLLSRVEEFGLQWEISIIGEIQFIGAARLHTSPRGDFLGSQPVHDNDLAELVLAGKELQLCALELIRDQGYFGPVGIDLMIHRDGLRQMVRPLQDINARWTMGRLAIEWGRVLRRSGIWRHNAFASSADDAISLSPERVGHQVTRFRTQWTVEQSDDQIVSTRTSR